MKKNVSMAILLALLFGFGFTGTSRGNTSRQSTQSTDQSQSDSTTAKKKKKPAADSSDAANSTQANSGDASATPKKGPYGWSKFRQYHQRPEGNRPRDNRPALLAQLTQKLQPLRQRPATLATLPVRGPHRSPRTNSQRPQTAPGWSGSIPNPAFTTNRERDGTARPSREST